MTHPLREIGDPFILGVNYWPRRKAMAWWADFDAGEVWEEFSLIGELGLDLVRIFLLWDDWQPEPDKVARWPCRIWKWCVISLLILA